MTSYFSEKKLLFYLLLSSAVLFLLLAYFSEATFDAGDGIRHYQISKYSWSHPELFLDSWGKPFYTLVSSPFSQFGFGGITFFNIACGIFSAFIVYKIAKKLGYQFSILAIPFLLFAPIYFPTMNSGLTEPLFGLILIGSVFLMLEKKYFWASLLVSFLPFVRSEGLLVLPLFFIILLYNKSFLNIFVLGAGTLLYSIVGFFYFGDFLWIKTQNPYNGANKDFYGHGEWFSFVKDYNQIWGITLGLLFVMGVIAIVFNYFLKKNSAHKNGKYSSFINEENILILGAFVLYFVAHSIMWWKGMANSMGILRVFAGVMPCSAIICLRGFNFVLPLFNRATFLKNTFVSLVLLFVLLCPFTADYFPYRFSKEQAVTNDVGEWLKKEGLIENKIYCQDPFLVFVLGVDPFNEQKVADLWGVYPTIKRWGINAIRNEGVLIWEAHYGPNECRIPLDTLMMDPNFDLIKTFYPKERFTSMGGIPYQVCVFVKSDKPKEKKTVALEQISFDLLNSEKNLYALTEVIEFGTSLRKNISDLPENTQKITLSGTLIDPENNHKNALVVFIVDNAEGKNVLWEGKSFSISTDSTNNKIATVDFDLNPAFFQPTDVFKTYIWNKEKKSFFLIDYKVAYCGNK